MFAAFERNVAQRNKKSSNSTVKYRRPKRLLK